MSTALDDVTVAQQAPPWSTDAGRVVAALGSDRSTGLEVDEARRRLREGRNVLPASTSPSLWALALLQLRETMIVVLVAAAVLTAAVGDLADTLIITIVITLNTTLGVVQQRRAQRAIAALASLAAPTARVVRSRSTQLLDAQDVVPGDVVELEAGDLVPADGRLLDAEGLEVDEATLTGESLAVTKASTRCPAGSLIADRTSMLHAGTVVTRGRARIIVTATGSRTQVGQLAHLLVSTTAPQTPLQVRLARFGRQVAAVTGALCLLFLVLGLLQGQGLETMTLTAISLAVAAVPESLPAVLVLSLAMSAQRMARRGAVVRTLPAVETLGAVTILASDKTGTLTEGTMFAAECWTPCGPVLAGGHGYGPLGALRGDNAAVTGAARLLRAIVLCNDAELVQTQGTWVPAGDPMEAALLALASKGGQRAADLKQQWPRLTEYAFDHARMRMTTVHRGPDGTVMVVCKGAPEVLLSLLDQPPSVTSEALAQVAEMTGRGLRVLAVAEHERGDVPADVTDAEHGLGLLGLVGLHDPPRQAAAAAVSSCRTAGIIPVMITGDHPATATAIASSLGLLRAGDVVVTGQEVEAGLEGLELEKIRVYARTAPAQKLAIVNALRTAGHVVAMTGDGVNDAPALKRADVGVAMGRAGTEVARQAADVVLADDDFATLVTAVAEGRRVYDNVRRFLVYALSGGAAEVLLMLSGPLISLPLPLLPGQILWVNMLTHGLPGIALGAERAEDDVLRRAPRDPREGLLGAGLLGQILLLGTLVAGVTLGVGGWARGAGHPWQSMVFVTLTLQQLGVALALRSQQRSMMRVGLRGNPLLLFSLAGNLGLLWLAISWAPLAGLLGTHPLTAWELVVCVATATLAPVAVEASKAWARRARRG